MDFASDYARSLFNSLCIDFVVLFGRLDHGWLAWGLTGWDGTLATSHRRARSRSIPSPFIHTNSMSRLPLTPLHSSPLSGRHTRQISEAHPQARPQSM